MMKHITILLLIFTSIAAYPQKSYDEVLKMTKEVKIIDRLYLDLPNLGKIELDEPTARQLFMKMYGGSENLPRDTRYYISGKITRHADFNLLFLYAESNATDSLKNFNLVLLTTKKDGTQIAMMEAAANRYYMWNNKMQLSKTRSYLYNGFKLKQENIISVMNKKFESEYRINDYGMIVHLPKS